MQRPDRKEGPKIHLGDYVLAHARFRTLAINTDGSAAEKPQGFKISLSEKRSFPQIDGRAQTPTSDNQVFTVVASIIHIDTHDTIPVRVRALARVFVQQETS